MRRLNAKRFLTEAITSARWRVRVAVESERVVAHLYLALIEKVARPTRDSRWIAYLTNVYTVPEHRNKGVGSELLAAAKEAARERWRRASGRLAGATRAWISTFRHGFRAERDPLRVGGVRTAPTCSRSLLVGDGDAGALAEARRSRGGCAE